MPVAINSDLIARLRAALTSADYRYDAVAARLGPTAHAALSRNETTPAMRRTGSGDRLDTLIRLWLLQQAVPIEAAEAALADADLGNLVDPLCTAQILTRTMAEVAARVDVRPYAAESAETQSDLWVLADLTPGMDGVANRVGADHVLGISSAATSLAQITDRRPVGSALDLGTGCGVQSLHLADHTDRVVATDVNERALWLTELNAALNGKRIEVRSGSFFEPVRGERFDLIVTNPPFVISPGTGDRLVYRDSGLPGDQVVEDIVRTAPQHLNPGGTCQILANWVIREDQPWQERLAEWLVGPDQQSVDAWVVQREVVDLPSYVELWLRDEGVFGTADYTRRYQTWLAWFADQGASAVGFGWINLRRREDTRPGWPVDHQFLEWPYEVAFPLGEAISAHFDAVDWLRRHELSTATLRVRPDVVQETVGTPGAEDPAAIVLRQQTGLRRARQVNTAEAGFVGACEGDLSVSEINAALEALDAGPVGSGVIAKLISEGFLTPGH